MERVESANRCPQTRISVLGAEPQGRWPPERAFSNSAAVPYGWLEFLSCPLRTGQTHGRPYRKQRGGSERDRWLFSAESVGQDHHFQPLKVTTWDDATSPNSTILYRYVNLGGNEQHYQSEFFPLTSAPSPSQFTLDNLDFYYSISLWFDSCPVIPFRAKAFLDAMRSDIISPARTTNKDLCVPSIPRKVCFNLGQVSRE